MYTVNLTEEQLAMLRRCAKRAWSKEEYDENYEDAVTCGNADDSYSAGFAQGEAVLAETLLESWGLLK